MLHRAMAWPRDAHESKSKNMWERTPWCREPFQRLESLLVVLAPRGEEKTTLASAVDERGSAGCPNHGAGTHVPGSDCGIDWDRQAIVCAITITRAAAFMYV
jgi:hypothetical protein